MKIHLVYIGREKKNHYSEAIELYLKRLKHYCQFELVAISPQKYSSSLSVEAIRLAEAKVFESHLKNMDKIILLDEGAKEYTSIQFSNFVQQLRNQSLKNVAFVIGGAYGFDLNFKAKILAKISLSKFTYPHHLAKLIFVEQLYRAFTIIKGEPYHNS